MPPGASSRLEGLDCLRGLAALSVLAFHYTTRFAQLYGRPHAPLFEAPWGVRGYELFFIVSGFAIELSLARCAGARDFVVSRFSRLYPAFWAAVVFTFTAVALFGLPGRETTLAEAALNLTMIPEGLSAPLVDGAYWTLQRELIFYALILALLLSGLRRFTVHALVAACLLEICDRLWPSTAPWRALAGAGLNFRYVHLFTCGAVLCRARTSRLALLGLLPALAAARIAAPDGFAWTLALTALVGLASLGWPRWLLRRPLLSLGAISYPLYLVHQNLGYLILRAAAAHGLGVNVAIVLALAAALCVAVLLHRGVEKPCMAWLRATLAGKRLDRGLELAG